MLNNRFAALGLSFDSQMGHDLTTACIVDQLDNNRVFVQTGVNVGFSNRVPKPRDYGVLAYNGSFSDGIISTSYYYTRI